jgi:phosphoglycolate phosphatase-like HAD superfamily hydrolase
MPPEKLVLFDIDGTLLWPDGAGRAAMKIGMQQVYGTSGSIEEYKFLGHTERETVFALLREAGLSEAEIEAGWEHLPGAMETALIESIRERRHNIRPCPGAHQLIQSLAQRSDVLLGLITGNFKETAMLKLQTAGFDPAVFTVAAYGHISADRADLPPVAVKQAQALTGKTYSGSQIVIIGDTPSDILCGRRLNARSLVVLTGWVSREVLEEHHPDGVFEDLSDTETVIAAIVK